MQSNHKVRTCLWFKQGGEAAAKAYVELIPDSKIENIVRAEPGGDAIMVDFMLGGAPYQILNGGPQFEQTPAASISVMTEDQAETDRLWDSLVSNGGEEGRCSWLVDRFGVSWQIVPKALSDMMSAEDREAAGRAQAAMMDMGKIEISTLETAFEAA